MTTANDDAHLPITRCPHCRTAFRVREIQLTQRRGMVRCGACRGVFNAIQHMLHQRGNTITIEPPDDAGVPGGYVDAPAALSPLTLMTEARTPHASDKTASAHAAPPIAQTQAAPETELESSTIPANVGNFGAIRTSSPPPTPSPISVEANARAPNTAIPTRISDTASARGKPIDHEIATDDLEAALAGKPKPLDAIERFEREDRNYAWRTAEAPRAPWAGVFWAFSCVVLTLALIAQSIYAFRNDIVSRFPKARPLLTQACAWVGCRVAAPERPDAMVIDGAEFTRDESHSGLYTLNATLRNKHSYPSAYPSLVVTLTGLNNEALSRRIFAPAEFLSGPADLKTGLPGNGEVEFKLFIDASTIQPVGFDVRTTYIDRAP